MAITFPSSPVDGQVFTATEADNKKSYIYQQEKGRWRIRTTDDILFVSTPKINSPTNGYLYASRTLTITSSDYYANDNTPDHQYSEWQISASDGFGTLIYETGLTSTSLTSLTVPSAILTYGTVYYVRVRYRSEAANGLGTATSEWSPTVSFRTDVNPGSNWTSLSGAESGLIYAAANYRITPSLTKQIVFGADNLTSNKLRTYYTEDDGDNWTFQELSFSSSTNFEGIIKYIWNGYRWYVIYDKAYTSRGINYINGSDTNSGYYSLWTHNYTYTTVFLDAVWNGVEFICIANRVSGGDALYLTRNSVNENTGNFIATPTYSLVIDSSSSTSSSSGYPKLLYLDENLDPSSTLTYRYHVLWKFSTYCARFFPSTGYDEVPNSIDDVVTDGAYLKLGTTWYIYVTRLNGALNRYKLDSTGDFGTFTTSEMPPGNSTGQTNHTIDSQTTQHLNSIAVKQGTCAIIVGNNKTILKTSTSGTNTTDDTGAYVTKYNTTNFAASNYNKIVYNEEYDVWVIIGTQGVILTSTDDGETWNAKASGTTVSLREILWTGDHFFAGGSGKILKS